MRRLKINEITVGCYADVRNEAAPDTKHIEKLTPAHFLRDKIWYGIEITPSFLEKNDFIEIKDVDEKIRHFQYQDNEYKIDIYFTSWQTDRKTKNSRIVNVYGALFEQNAYLNYVHELQMICQLYRIKKTFTM